MDVFTENYWPDIVNRLDPAACESGELFFISPYLTGDRFSQYLEEHDIKNAIVIVQLNPANVASGSLDLTELKHLLSICSLFTVPDLHAKIIVDKKTAFVGSQNLTRQGENRNHESTLITDDASAHNDALKYARDLLLKGRRVTSEMLDHVAKMASELEIHSKAMDDMNLRFMEAWSEENSNVVHLKDRRAAVKAEIATEFKELRITKKRSKNLEYWTLVPTAHSDKFNQWSRSDIWGYQMRNLGLIVDSLRPFWFFSNKTQVGRLYGSWMNGSHFSNTTTHLRDPRTTNDHSNVHVTWLDDSENDWIRYWITYFFDGSNCQFRSSGYRPFLRDKVAHNKMAERRIRERALACIAEYQTTDSVASVLDTLVGVEAYPESNKDYLNPLGYFSFNQPIQMSIAEISQYDWFNEELHHPYYFQFSQA